MLVDRRDGLLGQRLPVLRVDPDHHQGPDLRLKIPGLRHADDLAILERVDLRVAEPSLLHLVKVGKSIFVRLEKPDGIGVLPGCRGPLEHRTQAVEVGDRGFSAEGEYSYLIDNAFRQGVVLGETSFREDHERIVERRFRLEDLQMKIRAVTVFGECVAGGCPDNLLVGLGLEPPRVDHDSVGKEIHLDVLKLLHGGVQVAVKGREHHLLLCDLGGEPGLFLVGGGGEARSQLVQIFAESCHRVSQRPDLPHFVHVPFGSFVLLGIVGGSRSVVDSGRVACRIKGGQRPQLAHIGDRLADWHAVIFKNIDTL